MTLFFFGILVCWCVQTLGRSQDGVGQVCRITVSYSRMNFNSDGLLRKASFAVACAPGVGCGRQHAPSQKLNYHMDMLRKLLLLALSL